MHIERSSEFHGPDFDRAVYHCCLAVHKDDKANAGQPQIDRHQNGCGWCTLQKKAQIVARCVYDAFMLIRASAA